MKFREMYESNEYEEYAVAQTIRSITFCLMGKEYTHAYDEDVDTECDSLEITASTIMRPNVDVMPWEHDIGYVVHAESAEDVDEPIMYDLTCTYDAYPMRNTYVVMHHCTEPAVFRIDPDWSAHIMI